MATHNKLSTAELLFRRAQQMGLAPVWVMPLSVFAITVDGQERYVTLARSPLNSDSSVALAKNKYVTRRILERHNIRNIPFTLPHTQSEAEAFLSRHEMIVAKPVTGAGARDIHIISSRTHFQTLNHNIEQYILEKYIAGRELRYLLLNDEVIGVHRSEYGTSVAEDRPLQRISYPQDSWDPSLVELSLHIADILNLRFAAVDYLIDASGREYVLEVNTMPGLKWFHAPSSGPVVDVASLFLESIISAMRSEGQPPHSAMVSTRTAKPRRIVKVVRRHREAFRRTEPERSTGLRPAYRLTGREAYRPTTAAFVASERDAYISNAARL